MPLVITDRYARSVGWTEHSTATCGALPRAARLCGAGSRRQSTAGHGSAPSRERASTVVLVCRLKHTHTEVIKLIWVSLFSVYVLRC